MKLTAQDLQDFGIVDTIVPEPLGGAHREPAATVATVLDTVDAALAGLTAKDAGELLEERYQKYRRIGAWQTERRGEIGV